MNDKVSMMPDALMNRLISVLEIAKQPGLQDTKWIEVKETTVNLLRMGVMEVTCNLNIYHRLSAANVTYRYSLSY